MALRLRDLPWLRRGHEHKWSAPDDDGWRSCECGYRHRFTLEVKNSPESVEQATAAPGEKRNVRFENDCS